MQSLPPSSQGLTQSGAPSVQQQQKETVGQLLLLLPTVLHSNQHAASILPWHAHVLPAAVLLLF